MDATFAMTELKAETCPLTVLQPHSHGLSFFAVDEDAEVILEGKWR